MSFNAQAIRRSYICKHIQWMDTVRAGEYVKHLRKYQPTKIRTEVEEKNIYICFYVGGDLNNESCTELFCLHRQNSTSYVNE